ncbi:unnamed protein product, partial [Allacma fusca]
YKTHLSAHPFITLEVSSIYSRIKPKYQHFSLKLNNLWTVRTPKNALHESLDHQCGTGSRNDDCRNCSCGGRFIIATIRSQIEGIRKEGVLGSILVKSPDDGIKREKRGIFKKFKKRLRKFGKQIENIGKTIRINYSSQGGWNAGV